MAVAEWSKARRQRRHVASALRSATKVGKNPVVLGSPVIDASDLEIGDGFRVWSAHRQTLITGAGRLRIGNDCFINAGTIIFCELAVTLGNDVALANEVYVMDSPSHGIEGRNPEAKPVVIGDGTWVGARAIVLPGVTIGRRVAVGAGAVVTKDVPDDVLVAGNPARVVRPLTYPPLCRRAWHDVFCACPGSMFGPPLED